MHCRSKTRAVAIGGWAFPEAFKTSVPESLRRGHCRYAIHFVVCGENVAAQTDVCLIQRNSTSLLIVQSDKNALSSRDPEPQVVAEAIAAFQQNNRKRTSVGLVELDTMVIPCITMIGTRPIFYKVPVTKALSDAVVTGRYPQQRTIVS